MNHHSDHGIHEQSVFQCKECDFIFVYPHRSEIPSVTYDQETQDDFKFWGSKEAEIAYAAWREQVHNSLITRISHHLKGKKILEIGFGEGPLTEKVAPIVSEYWGIEPVPASHQRTIDRLHLAPTQALCLTAEELSSAPAFKKKENYFDAIILISVFEHLSSPKEILRQCNKLLTPNGKLFLTTPNSRYFKQLRLVRRLLGMEPWSHFHISFFKEKHLAILFEDTNFSIKARHYDPLATELSIDYFKKLKNSKFVGYAMTIASRLGIDRLLHINSLFYELKKK
nr:class I SAM-dependent methyltransferase [uncultured Pseudodesulfovibrio sp.]